MAALVLAGGAIYGLPYLRQSYHGPMLEALGITHTELGILNASFGLVALLCYFPGGFLADRFPARHLLVVSLLGTGAGGVLFSTLPGYGWVLVIHAFWGVSSILTFWAALIRATRSWAGPTEQGRAFGLLDGGRGLVEAIIAALALVVFGYFENASVGLSAVLLSYALACFFAAAMVWRFIPSRSPSSGGEAKGRSSGAGATPEADGGTSGTLGAISTVARRPVVWLLASVILLAYAGYWGTFDFAAFALDGYGTSDVYAAGLGTFRLWIRPAAAIAAGAIADRVRPSRAVAAGFVMMSLGYAAFALVPPGALATLWVKTAVVALAAFALRGIYFALMEEGQIPMAYTGTVVGLVSVVGYTPDVVQPLAVGVLLDTFPGAAGHRVYYAILASLAVLGAIAALAVPRAAASQFVLGRRRPPERSPEGSYERETDS